MANSLREVKRRIISTEGTAQITKAMHMVSSSKVKKAEKKYKSYIDFMQRIKQMVSHVAAKTSEEYVHPLMENRTNNKTIYMLITADKGLAGAYNSGLFKALEEKIKDDDKNNIIFSSVGKQGYNYIKRKGYNSISNEPILIRDDAMFLDILPLALKFIEMFLKKEIDKVIIVYNHFINNISQEVVFEELLPLASIDKEESSIDYIYENGVEYTLDLLLPMYIQDIIYGIILDAKVAEHSARMNAMKNATDNANEVIEKLRLLYNRARQDAITTELIDIIGGANAIGGDE